MNLVILNVPVLIIVDNLLTKDIYFALVFF